MSGNGQNESEGPRVVAGTITAVSKDGRGFKIGENWYNVSQFGQVSIEEGLGVGEEVMAVVDKKQGKFIKDLHRANGGGETAPNGGGTAASSERAQNSPAKEEPKPETGRGTSSHEAPRVRVNDPAYDDRLDWARRKNDFIVLESAIGSAVELMGFKVALGQIPKDGDLLALALDDADRIASHIKASADKPNGASNATPSPSGKRQGKAGKTPRASSAPPAKAPTETDPVASNSTLKTLIDVGTGKLGRSQKELNADAYERYGKEVITQLTESEAQDYIKFLVSQLRAAG